MHEVLPPNDPKLSDPAREGARLQPEREGRVRCSAWLGGTVMCLIFNLNGISWNRPKRVGSPMAVVVPLHMAVHEAGVAATKVALLRPVVEITARLVGAEVG